MTTTATGLLCWRDFHPQEWQLASLHQILEARPVHTLGVDLSQALARTLPHLGKLVGFLRSP